MSEEQTPEPPTTAMQRIEATEKRVTALEAALRRAFGTRWMDERQGGDEPTVE